MRLGRAWLLTPSTAPYPPCQALCPALMSPWGAHFILTYAEWNARILNLTAHFIHTLGDGACTLTFS